MNEIPQRGSQEVLATLWRELLEVSAVRPEDNFVDQGGNSLLATVLANRIEEELNVRPTLVEIFSSTLQELAAVCDQLRAGGGKP